MLIVLQLLCLLVNVLSVTAHPRRFTFELPDNDHLCFFEDLAPSKKYVLMYQVIHGGQLDIDLRIADPSDKEISKTERTSHDQVFFTSGQNGSYSFCFSNEFSSVSHKLIYFELRLESYESLSEEMGMDEPPSPLTMMESGIEMLHLFLSRAETLQIEFKNRELGDRIVAEELNSAVLFWSLAVSLAILVTTVGQVTILKHFFTEKKVVYSTHTSRF
ncbi:unnamed protein product [Calicophoron daubneyi]|uniref:GOLD domain-containing protein n=1 Tax=Calicophoron daubneyi TaxID=300641 RepID=A0AAV2TBR8_CALDB